MSGEVGVAVMRVVRDIGAEPVGFAKGQRVVDRRKLDLDKEQTTMRGMEDIEFGDKVADGRKERDVVASLADQAAVALEEEWSIGVGREVELLLAIDQRERG